jgi:hypothetical protein
VESSGEARQYRRAPDALWRELADCVLLLSPTMDEPIAIVRPAADAWSLFGERADLDAIARVLAARYGADAAMVRRDLQPVIDQLVGAALLVCD